MTSRLRDYCRAVLLFTLSLLAVPTLATEPAELDGLVLWLRADDVDGDGQVDAPGAGAAVARWADRSGRGNDVVQPLEDRQPKVVHAAMGGQPVLRFDGGDCLELGKTNGLDAGDQAFHAFIVMRGEMSPGHPNPRILDLGGAAVRPELRQRGFWVGYQGNGRNRLGVSNGDEAEARRPAWNGQPQLMEVTYGGRGQWGMQLNGASDGRGTYRERPFLGFRDPVSLAIGQHFGLTQANTFFLGDLAEVLLFRRVLAPQEQHAIGDYLGRKYGVTTAYGALPQFESEILPVLARRCHKCHGAKRQEGELDLRTVTAMLRGGSSGSVLVRGHAERSYFLQLIDAGEMPPAEETKLTKDELALLRLWVDLGAPAKERVVEPTRTDHYRQQHRGHWAFRTPSVVTPPKVRQPQKVGTPVDAFILRRLEAEGMTLAPRAARATLARRAYFDLTGLPPSPEELELYLQDESPQAYARLIDRLLESPDYGERWARHWLDVVRYADYYDNDAKARQMTAEPLDAWRYRDWVVRALNQDLPFDRFIVHQIAGDLLPNPTGDGIYPDGLVATTFLSNGVWDPHDADKEKIVSDMADDNIDTIGKAFLGLTLGCARCHDHKFDPVTTEDYYALAGMFYSTHFLAALGTKGGAYTMNRVPLVSAEQVAKRQEQVAQLKQINEQLAALDKRQPPPPKDDAQRQQLITQRDTLQRTMLPETPRAIAVQEGGTPGGLFPNIQDVPIHIRGSYTRLGRVVPRGLPRFFAGDEQPPITQGSGRRELAQWIAAADNPLTARVIVNRVWQWHLGDGIVRTPNNFGIRAETPSHPELLDWLASEFVANGWSLKRLHRWIMLSNTYQQTSRVDAALVERDPDNRLLARFAPRRLEAEAIRDAMLFVSGRLDRTTGGPAGADLNIQRRSLYVQTARWNRSNFATLFDAANPDASTAKRVSTTVTPQSLFLLNNTFTLTQARHVAQRVLTETSADGDAGRVNRLYHLLFGRAATESEQNVARTIVAATEQRSREDAWVDLAHVLLCTNEFVYLD